ncbi:MAG: MotA/TolQ/ExbB proton channel family protein [Gammaproteobacteria bacterium]|nr:MAG: MotA/TolQ/ExbB proton channel family protein [Gammaproteobacteria bacterium]
MVDLAALALTIALAAQQQPVPPAPPAEPATSGGDPGLTLSQGDLPPVDTSGGLPATETAPALEPPPDVSTPEVPPPVDNPYGLSALWAQGDFVAKGTLIILVVMSLASWFIILTKLWDQSRLRRQFVQTEKGFWSGRSLQDGIATLKDSDNAFRMIAEQGVKAAQHHEGRLTDQIPLHEWVTQSLQRAVDRVSNDLQGGLSFLATTGSTAPFIGLFGTVWGIYHALINIGIAGQASIDKVAGPVGEALIMTAIGLAVAVPAVLGYNWLLRRNKALLEEVRYFATDVQAYLISGARVEGGGRPASASAGPRSK